MNSVRLATEADVPALQFLASAAPEGVISSPERWAHRLGDGSAWTDLALVTVVDDSPVGFLWAEHVMAVDKAMPLPWLCLNALYVDPDHRGAGTGAALVAEAERRAKGFGQTVLHGSCLLSVAEYWRKLGFEMAEPGTSWVTPLVMKGTPYTLSSGKNYTFWKYLTPPVPIVLF